MTLSRQCDDPRCPWPACQRARTITRCDNCGTNDADTVPFSWPGSTDVWAYCLPCDAAARKTTC